MHQRLSVLIVLAALVALCAAAPSILSKRAHCIGQKQLAMCDANKPLKPSRLYRQKDALKARRIVQEMLEEPNPAEDWAQRMLVPTWHEGKYPGYEGPFVKYPISEGEVTVHRTYLNQPFCDFVILDKDFEVAAILNGLSDKPCPIIDQDDLLDKY
ncbi:hypothetical protein K3495_g776 [Podosphaera aphanis]|nr:hypothetical protein K3495_g776 [Podosphaera aphanis]